ncbi:FAD-dependent oxidoreductase [Streptacidiphilus sp. P02-A3a]|uniref:FAD-dependent oxidoreductase n=1 Tax=Streptacidiphilus sp. P02-A3a TaxID=2704468 RepID=UPI0015F9755C|nr:FAD-dependent oxidoreductase [Streptacidiphilus sp. P02-A3a]QMU67062.1 FAD-dependent oxidoreductase [Streptacidiphilus sp. P02-A3a]
MPQPLVPDTDLVVIGGGPAGCAAAVMAASVGLRSVLVEPRALGHTLRRIPALENVLGFSSGPDYADALAADVRRAARCEVLLGASADRLDAADDHVTVHLAGSGRTLTGRFAVVATGVRDARPDEADWITGADPRSAPLWQADAGSLADRTTLVLGADRPLGTLLRGHPEAPLRLVVPYPEADAYKTDEVRDDPRVTLVPVRSLALSARPGGGVLAEATTPDGRTGQRLPAADAVFVNLGCRPSTLPGLRTAPDDGYCPPDRQHPRVLTAGDLRSARAQRIMTATGSGAEAALRAYYATRLDS